MCRHDFLVPNANTGHTSLLETSWWMVLMREFSKCLQTFTVLSCESQRLVFFFCLKFEKALWTCLKLSVWMLASQTLTFCPASWTFLSSVADISTRPKPFVIWLCQLKLLSDPSQFSCQGLKPFVVFILHLKFVSEPLTFIFLGSQIHLSFVLRLLSFIVTDSDASQFCCGRQWALYNTPYIIWPI